MNLPPLPPTDISREELVASHRGPTKRSNWVIPGSLLCGDRSSLDSEEGLNAIFSVGVSMVVCLQTRQETSAAVDYRKRALAIFPGTQFIEQPIPDQEVTDDWLIEDLLLRLLEHLSQGQVPYVHCRGGHGRTGTVCSLLLARLYNLSAAEAMARIQLYHDARKQPVFCASGYQELKDGSGCVVLFPPQRAQVLRLLRGDEVPEPVDLTRAQSTVYGKGASKYDETVMREWLAAAKAATEILNSSKKGTGQQPLYNAVELFWKASRLRPDFARVYVGLSEALCLLGEGADAREALLQGLQMCPEDRTLLQELQKFDEASCMASEVATPNCSDSGYEAPLLNSMALADIPDPSDATPSPEVSWFPRIIRPRFVMLVGLPGSGKSTFAEQLVRSGGGWVRLCQDEMEGRDALENVIGHTAKDDSTRLVIDRTNVKRADRKAFLSLAFDPEDAVCVHFDFNVAECEGRVAKRTDHPTIRYGGGRNAVRSMFANFEKPLCSEGFAEVFDFAQFR